MPSEGFFAAATPICFSLTKQIFRDALKMGGEMELLWKTKQITQAEK